MSKKTSYVVAGPTRGPSCAAPRKLNIPVLTEDEFLELLK
ncbi:MAG: BRCT domain-containing protein [Oscillospiraceae bacterium]